MIDRKILKKAIEKWGKPAQIEMVKEECLELALALQKLNRKRGDIATKVDNIFDEIADVSIMIEQCRILFDEEQIDERINFKMNRLKQRIEEVKNEGN
jgi:NTP pyrophosphatase (non-canonical NTP hydrolase)